MAKAPKSGAKSRVDSTAVKAERLLAVEDITRLHAWAWEALTAGGEHAMLGAIVLLLLGTAARRMELCAFEIRDFTKGSEGPQVTFRVAKGGNTGAVVPLTSETWRAFTLWLEQKRKLGESIASNAPVFCGRNGEYMGMVTLWRRWLTALEIVGIPHKKQLGVHASRHAAAYLIFRATGSYAVVKRVLRHTNVRTTEAFYEHFNLDDLRQDMTRAGI